MTLVAARTVTHTPLVGAGENAHGQPVFTNGATRVRAVYGWEPKQNFPDNTPGTADRVITDIGLLTPDPDWEHGDVVVVDAKRYAVFGAVEDYSSGPFGYAGGYRVTLRRIADGDT